MDNLGEVDGDFIRAKVDTSHLTGAGSSKVTEQDMELDSNDEVAYDNFEQRLSCLIRISTIIGDDIDERDELVKSQESDQLNMKPNRRMFDSDDEEENKDLFD